jgi:1,4-alpha-glucan branching enzyme
LQRFVEDLNRLYHAHPGLWEGDYEPGGFSWMDCTDQANSTMSFVRRNTDRQRELVVVLNLTPVLRMNYRVGLPRPGHWREILNSDAAIYGGSNAGNLGGVTAEDWSTHGQPHSAPLTLPPLSITVFEPERG